MSSLSIFIMENVPQSLRGELTRWMIEPKAGVFVGKLSALVRDKLWNKIGENVIKGGCILIYTNNNEQGYSIRTHGKMDREIIYLEGLYLVRKSNKP